MMSGSFPGRGVGRGFTLIELLVVIAVIALLVSLLMPSLKKAKGMAQTAACAMNLRSQGVGVFYYAEDYEDHMPALCDGEKVWADDVLVYAGGGSVFACPSSTGSNIYGVRPKYWRGSQGAAGSCARTWDYAINCRAFGVQDVPGGWSLGRGWPRLSERWEHSLTKEHMPKQTTFILGEGRLEPWVFRSYWEPGECIYESGVYNPWAGRSKMTKRHLDGGANNFFADGHVDFVLYEDLLRHGEYWGPDIAYRGSTPGHGPYDDYDEFFD